LPTSRVLKKYAMLVLCGRQFGLVCSVTRLIHFGRMPDQLRLRAEGVAAVDAAFICSTRAGQRMNQVFLAGLAAYARAGFPEEWRLHHQGGPVGYEPREFVVTEATDDIVCAGQAYAWNPTITGAKSEDTILVGPDGAETLTLIDGWPMIEADFDGHTLLRPAVLEID
jgi:antitoxin VapB